MSLIALSWPAPNMPSALMQKQDACGILEPSPNSCLDHHKENINEPGWSTRSWDCLPAH